MDTKEIMIIFIDTYSKLFKKIILVITYRSICFLLRIVVKYKRINLRFDILNNKCLSVERNAYNLINFNDNKW